jgi:hypothetical protein
VNRYTADSIAHVSGADLCHTRTKTASQTDQDGDTSTWSETSTTRLFAIDIEGRTLPKDLTWSNDPGKASTKAPPAEDAGMPNLVDIDGNVAMMQANVLIEGEDTYASVDTSLLAVEDTLSTVNAWITAGIG